MAFGNLFELGLHIKADGLEDAKKAFAVVGKGGEEVVRASKAQQREINKGINLLRQMAATVDKNDKAAIAGLQKMVAEQKQWSVAIGATTSQMLRLGAVERQVSDMADHANRGAVAFGKLRSIITSGLAFAGVSVGIQQLVHYADTWQLIESRLRLVTKSSDELKKVQGDLFAISQRTRTDFEATAELYSRVARNAGQLGKSQKELADFTEAVQKTMKLSGTSTQEAAAATIQLGQALASGRLQGDEFRSIMENAPGLARAIADGLGVTTGALREMSKEGKLTAQEVVGAVLKMKDSIDRDFRTVPVTLSDAFTVLKNSLFRFVGQANSAAGATSMLAKSLVDFANGIPSLDNKLGGFLDWLKDIELHLNIAAQGANNFGSAIAFALSRGRNQAAFQNLVTGLKAIQDLRKQDAELEARHARRSGIFGDVTSGFSSGSDVPPPSGGGGGGGDKKKVDIRSNLNFEDATFKALLERTSQMPSISVMGVDLNATPVPGVGMSVDQLDELFKNWRKGVEARRDQVLAEEQRQIEEHRRQLEEGAQRIKDTITQGFSQTLGDAIYNGFAAAFNGEGVGGILKAFGKTVLAGVGQMFTQLGSIYLEYGVLMQSLSSLLPNPFTAGPAGIAIGAALIAMGAALGAVANGGGGRGTAHAGAFRERPNNDNIVRLKFVDRPNALSNVSPVQPVVINAYGPNDPKTQRWMLETFSKAQRR